MWSLAGNQAVDQPIQQLFSWDVQEPDPAALGLESLQVALCLERRQRADPGALGLSLSGGRGRPGTESLCTGSEVLGLWVEQLASAPDALGGFRCGRPSRVSCVCPQFANLRVRNRASGERQGCLSGASGPGAEGGRGARGRGCC